MTATDWFGLLVGGMWIIAILFAAVLATINGLRLRIANRTSDCEPQQPVDNPEKAS